MSHPSPVHDRENELPEDDVTELRCRKCGYIWEARVQEPKACPECKSRNWK